MAKKKPDPPKKQSGGLFGAMTGGKTPSKAEQKKVDKLQAAGKGKQQKAAAPRPTPNNPTPTSTTRAVSAVVGGRAAPSKPTSPPPPKKEDPNKRRPIYEPTNKKGKPAKDDKGKATMLGSVTGKQTSAKYLGKAQKA